jgi:hypothetical protein
MKRYTSTFWGGRLSICQLNWPLVPLGFASNQSAVQMFLRGWLVVWLRSGQCTSYLDVVAVLSTIFCPCPYLLSFGSFALMADGAGLRLDGAASSLAPYPDINAIGFVFGDADAPRGTGILSVGITAASETMAGLRVIGAKSSLALCPDVDVVASVFGDADAPGGTGILSVALATASGTMASMGNSDDAFKSSKTFVLRMENVSKFDRDPGHLQWVPQGSCPRSCHRIFRRRWPRYIIDGVHHSITLRFRGGT